MRFAIPAPNNVAYEELNQRAFCSDVVIFALYFCLSAPAVSAAHSVNAAQACEGYLLEQAAFARATHNFLNSTSVDLPRTMGSAEQRQAYLAQEPIQKFLTRPASSLKWDSSHPILGDTNDPLNFETQIYNLTEDLIPYRNNHGRAEFYASGTRKRVLPFLSELLRRKHPNLFIAKPIDVYQVRHFVNTLTHPEAYLNNYGSGAEQDLLTASRARLLLFPMAKNSHMASIVVIFDPIHRRPLAALWVNTNKSADSYAYYAYRWNLPDNYRYYLPDDGVSRLEGLPFLKGRAVGSVDEGLTTDHVEDFLEQYRVLVMNRPIPFLDVSHQLQLDEDDLNCSLYTFNFLDAVGRLVEDKVDLILAVATRVANGDRHVEASEDLMHLIENGTKPFLPQYFAAGGTPRSREDIKRYHLHFRWDIGSEYIRELARPDGFFQVDER